MSARVRRRPERIDKYEHRRDVPRHVKERVFLKAINRRKKRDAQKAEAEQASDPRPRGRARATRPDDSTAQIAKERAAWAKFETATRPRPMAQPGKPARIAQAYISPEPRILNPPKPIYAGPAHTDENGDRLIVVTGHFVSAGVDDSSAPFDRANS